MTTSRNAQDVQAAIELLDEQLALECERRGLPGLAVTVVLDEEIVLAKGYGVANLQSNIATTPQTAYRVNSITKLFTATMLLQLRDAGKLHLDEPIQTYLPTFRIGDSSDAPRPPTFRQLVSHTAGLPSFPPMAEFNDPETMIETTTRGTFVFPAIDAVLASVCDVELIVPPMTAIRYSNLGFAILGHALERIADQPFQDYVMEHILQPLGMTNSGFVATSVPRQLPTTNVEMATGYVSRTPLRVAYSLPMGAFAPAGQLSASPTDMAQFLKLHSGGDSSNGTPVLNSVTMREMHAPVLLDSDWQGGVATGWFLRRFGGHTVLRHGGAGHDFIVVIAIVPQVHLGLGLFTNIGALSVDPPVMDRLVMDCLEVLLPTVTRP